MELPLAADQARRPEVHNPVLDDIAQQYVALEQLVDGPLGKSLEGGLVSGPESELGIEQECERQVVIGILDRRQGMTHELLQVSADRLRLEGNTPFGDDDDIAAGISDPLSHINGSPDLALVHVDAE